MFNPFIQTYIQALCKHTFKHAVNMSSKMVQKRLQTWYKLVPKPAVNLSSNTMKAYL